MELRAPQRGDVIRTKREEVRLQIKLTFWHWAVFVSPTEVIHYTSPTSDAGGDSMKIQPTDFEGFLKGNNQFEIVEFPSEYESQKSFYQGLIPSSKVTKQPPINPLKWLLPGFLSIPMAAAKVVATINSFNYKLATPEIVVERARNRCGEQNYNFLFNSKRTARTVLTGMCYSVGSVMRQGSSSLTRLTGQSAMTSRTWRR